jgi:single-stranded-DNA-specific exonuclease
VAGTIAALVASGEPVLVVCADARWRRRHWAGRLGGFALCSWLALERDPGLAARHAHVVALDPPAHAGQDALLRAAAGTVHLAWGEDEARFALAAAEHAFTLRAPAATLFGALRDGTGLASAIDQIGDPALAGRALRVLAEVELVAVDPAARTAALITAGRTDLERSPTHRAAAARLAIARARLGAAPRAARAAAA